MSITKRIYFYLYFYEGKTHMKNKNLSQGFTIVELLVVISIIALLIGILVPAVQKARDSAKVTQSKSNIHQVMIALATYASDHNDRNFTVAPDNLSSGPRNGMHIKDAIAELSAPGQAFGMGLRLGNVGEDQGGTVYSIGMAAFYGGATGGIAPYCFQSGLTESTTDKPGYGVWRYPNGMPVAEYMDGDTLHDAYFAPKDIVPLEAIEGCEDVTGSYCLTTEMASAGGQNPALATVESNMFAIPSSYCISPCMMYSPAVYQWKLAPPNGNQLPTDPMRLQRGFRPPSLDQARYPSHKTWLMEHNWLQNNTSSSNSCNRSHIEKNTWFVQGDGAYGDGCTPGHYNTHPDSSPVIVFADGAVKTYVVNDFIIDSEVSMQNNEVTDPLGLWVTSKKMVQGGSLTGGAFDNGPHLEYFGDVAEIKYGDDPISWSGHTHTKFGVRGRDKLAK
jgi:prepilin-type N-terminal cleavage/methylation domain-containing protein